MLSSCFPPSAKRLVPAQEYQHLDLSTPLNLPEATRILHVTKEFGPATMGGLGVMLTALASAQAKSSRLSIAVALPHYSYLSAQLSHSDVRPFVNLTILVTTRPWYRWTLRTRYYRCPVSLLRWSPGVESTIALNETDDAIDVYLIGPSDERPFSAAFLAKDQGDIYSAYKPLKQEWKDLYFARAVAALVRQLDEGPTATLDAVDRVVDVVHLHGATNAMVAHFMRADDARAAQRSAVVYSLHDSLDEVEYSNLVKNVEPFLPASAATGLARLRPYTYRRATQLFTSALGIDLSDVTTFVSRSIAADIVGRQFRFHLEDLVMPSIAAKATDGDFIGVTNALDLSDPNKNPFTSPILLQAGLAFPALPEGVANVTTSLASGQVPLPLIAAKRRARQKLLERLPRLFTAEDRDRPWFLFIGRYQYNKGCQFFATLLEVLAQSPTSGRLILLGARNNYPFDELLRLSRLYATHLTLIDDRTPATSHIQRDYGPILRMASDVAFVPSLSEAFGLVAAEALLFGMPVLSTGVGGLREFLALMQPTATGGLPASGNSYLFDLFPEQDTPATQGAERDYSQSAEDVRPSDELLAPARVALRMQAQQAVRDWQVARDQTSPEERESFARRLVQQALSLQWDRPGGPVEEVSFAAGVGDVASA